MLETGNNTGENISVRVALSGYVSRIEKNGVSVSSGWMSADRFFTDPQFRKRYGRVSISVFTPVFTLVPGHFFGACSARFLLSGVADTGRCGSSGVRTFAADEVRSGLYGIHRGDAVQGCR